MTRISLVLSVAFSTFLVGCGQLSQAGQDPEKQAGKDARYVDALALTVSGQYSDAMVISVVPVKHVLAKDAEAALKRRLPEGVAISQVGNKEIVFQGLGKRVADGIRMLNNVDVAPAKK